MSHALLSRTDRRSDLGVCVRAFDLVESRSSDDGRTLEGYAAVFNSPSRIRDIDGDFDEVITPGAFRRSLQTRTPVLQFDHGKDPRIGGVPIGTFEDLYEDGDRGLYVRARLFDHPDVERVRQAIAGGALRGMSFRFEVPKQPVRGDSWTKRSDDVDLREIRDADIHELGPVVFPAYDKTSVSVRSLLAQLDPSEYRSLVRELAAQLRAADLTEETETESRDDESREDTDLDGRPAQGAGGVDIGDPSGSDVQPPQQPQYRQRLDHGALRVRGILL